LDDKYPEDASTRRIREAVLKLPAGDALDLLAGEALYLEQGRIGAWRVRLERGAGFYFDACYAVTDFSTLRTILVSGTGPATVVHTAGTLGGFPPDTPLW
jgi:hypothetical protein